MRHYFRFAVFTIGVTVVFFFTMLHLRWTSIGFRGSIFDSKDQILSAPRNHDARGPKKFLSGIPKVLHLSYRNSDIPAQSIGWVKKWSEIDSELEILFWDDADIDNFVQKFYPHLHKVFKAYSHNVMRADAWRYMVMHHFGGIYADLDIEPLLRLDPVFDNHTCILAQEPELHWQIFWKSHVEFFKQYEDTVQRLACNALMGSVPGHRFMSFVIDELLRQGKDRAEKGEQIDGSIVAVTGPIFLSVAVAKYNASGLNTAGNAVFVSPSYYFMHEVSPRNAMVNSYINGCRHDFKEILQRCPNDKTEFTHEDLCSTQLAPVPAEEKFTTHHWMNTYSLGHEVVQWRSIADIPNVRFANITIGTIGVESRKEFNM